MTHNSYLKYIAEARQSAGLTQAQVSEYFRYKTPQFVSNWERGLSYPPIKSLRKLAALYNIDANVLFELMLRDYLAAQNARLRKQFHKTK